MDPATIAMLGSLGLKGLSSLFGGRSKKKQNRENRRATVAGLNIRQKQGEDARRARLALANGLLGGVPATTAGGGVNTNVAIDPELMRQLGMERTYDFGSALPQEVGGTDSFLAGLFGGAADVVPGMFGGGGDEGRIQGIPLPAGGGGAADLPNAAGSLSPPTTISWEELVRQAGGGGG